MGGRKVVITTTLLTHIIVQDFLFMSLLTDVTSVMIDRELCHMVHSILIHFKMNLLLRKNDNAKASTG